MSSNNMRGERLSIRTSTKKFNLKRGKKTSIVVTVSLEMPVCRPGFITELTDELESRIHDLTSDFCRETNEKLASGGESCG